MASYDGRSAAKGTQSITCCHAPCNAWPLLQQAYAGSQHECFSKLLQARNMKFNMKQALLFVVKRKKGFSLLAQTSADHRSAHDVGLVYFDEGIKGIRAHQQEA
jgi:hypothetical protein